MIDLVTVAVVTGEDAGVVGIEYTLDQTGFATAVPLTVELSTNVDLTGADMVGFPVSIVIDTTALTGTFDIEVAEDTIVEMSETGYFSLS